MRSAIGGENWSKKSSATDKGRSTTHCENVFFFSIPFIYQTTAKALQLPEHPSYNMYIITSNCTVSKSILINKEIQQTMLKLMNYFIFNPLNL